MLKFYLLLLFSHLVLSDSLQPHGFQHAKLSCPPLSPGVCSNSCSLSRWHCLTISSSAAFFSFCLQSFPASWSFPMSQLFDSGGHVLELHLQHQSFQWISFSSVTQSCPTPCDPMNRSMPGLPVHHHALQKLLILYTWDGCLRESLEVPKGSQATCSVCCGSRGGLLF